MSGRHFDYQQHRIDDIAREIEHIIATNDSNETENEDGDVLGRHYPSEVIEKFRKAVKVLYGASKMVLQIDWLLSSDSGPGSFLRNWDRSVPEDFR